MRRLCCTAQFVAALALAGCGTVEVFGRYDLPEEPHVAEAPWPRLVDTPDAPPAGTYTAAAPDPARGDRANRDLKTAASVAAVRAELLSAPVIAKEDKQAIERRATRRRR